MKIALRHFALIAAIVAPSAFTRQGTARRTRGCGAAVRKTLTAELVTFVRGRLRAALLF